MEPTDRQRLLHAISFAARAHEGQRRKDNVTPYVAHPMRVLTVMMHEFSVTDPQVLIAAVLHDTLEDTTTDYDDLVSEFGQRVADFVAQLSKDKRLPEAQREQAYLATLAAAPVEVKICKLADVFDNLVDAAGLPQPAQLKTVNKAKGLLELFDDSLEEPWRHVWQRVRTLVETVLLPVALVAFLLRVGG